MNEEKLKQKIKTYPKWVGVLLSFFISGLAQFLTGHKMIGVLWYVGLLLMNIIAFYILASPLESGFVISIVLWGLSFIAWIIMLNQSYRLVRRIGIKGWGLVIIVALSLRYSLGFLVKLPVETFNLPTTSMEPTIMGDKKTQNGEIIPGTGDRLIVEKVSYLFRSPQRGDLAVFKTQSLSGPNKGKYFIKRIVGLSGETISINPPYVYINDEKLIDPPIFKKLAESSVGYTSSGSLKSSEDNIKLGSNEYYVLGDNSARSADSRFWGPVPKTQITGRAVRIIWPLNRIKLLE